MPSLCFDADTWKVIPGFVVSLRHVLQFTTPDNLTANNAVGSGAQIVVDGHCISNCNNTYLRTSLDYHFEVPKLYLNLSISVTFHFYISGNDELPVP